MGAAPNSVVWRGSLTPRSLGAVFPDPRPAAGDMAVLRAVHLLTDGVIGAWADEAAVRQIARRTAPRATVRQSVRRGLIECRRIQDPRSVMRNLDLRLLLRLTADGMAQYIAWEAA